MKRFKLLVVVETSDRAFREEEVRAAAETAIRRELNWTVKNSVRDVYASVVKEPSVDDRQLTLVP